MEPSLTKGLLISLLIHLLLLLVLSTLSLYSFHQLSGNSASSGPFAFVQVFIPGEPGKLIGGKSVAKMPAPQPKELSLPIKSALAVQHAEESKPTQSALETAAGEGGGVLGGGVGGSGSGVTDPRYRQIREQIERAKVYPQLALRQGQAGVVRLRFRIDERGEPEEASIEQSSGFGLLDQAAINTVRRAAPFPVVSGWLTFPLRYDLEVALGR